MTTQITYTTLYSKPHNFTFDERFHPGRGNEIAQRGWRAIVRAECGERSAVAEACLGLNESATLASARELAASVLYSVETSAVPS